MTKATKPRSRRLHAFDKEIIASITNEKLYFDMCKFTTSPLTRVLEGEHEGEWVEPLPTCATASCMAGHINARRRPLAKRLANKPEFRTGYNKEDIDHAAVAREIYKRETGKVCRLDFLGLESTRLNLFELTRADAVAHIKGVHPTWPLFPELDHK